MSGHFLVSHPIGPIDFLGGIHIKQETLNLGDYNYRTIPNGLPFSLPLSNQTVFQVSKFEMISIL